MLEGGLRVYNPFDTRVVRGEINLPANRQYVFKHHSLRGLDPQIIHSKNSLGFRGPELPANGLASRLSMIMVGGSTTECFYLSDGKDWPALVREKLQDMFPDVWVNNAGLDGHSTFGHLKLVQDYLLDLHPRYILFLVGINDVAKNDISMREQRSLENGILTVSFKAFVASAAHYSEVLSLLQNVYSSYRARAGGVGHLTLNLAQLNTMDWTEDEVRERLTAHREEHLDNYAQRLTTLIESCLARGIQPILMTQAVLYGEGVDPDTGIDLAHMQVGTTSGHEQWRVLELYNDATRQVAARNNVFLIDLATEMEKSSAYYYDYMHNTNAGSERVAHIVAAHLATFLKQNHP